MAVLSADTAQRVPSTAHTPVLRGRTSRLGVQSTCSAPTARPPFISLCLEPLPSSQYSPAAFLFRLDYPQSRRPLPAPQTGSLVHFEAAAVVETGRVASVAHHEVGGVVVKAPLAAPHENVRVLAHGGRGVDERSGDVGCAQRGGGTQQTLTVIALNTETHGQTEVMWIFEATILQGNGR